MKYILIIFAICTTVFGAGFAAEKKVLISIAPYAQIVREIAGNDVQVVQLVPSGVNFHAYEPTARQLQDAASCAVWLKLGDSFEKKAQAVLLERNEKMIIADLRKGIPIIHEHGDGHEGECAHMHDACDPHIWMSPRLMQVQAETICLALMEAFPESKEQFRQGKEKVVQQLKALDSRITELLHDKEGGCILVSHPAYGYFCRDYGITEKSIEQEGKEPSLRYITAIIKFAKEKKIKKIFVQPQHPVKAAHLLAKTLGVEVVTLDPYSERYYENMRNIAMAFREAL